MLIYIGRGYVLLFIKTSCYIQESEMGPFHPELRSCLKGRMIPEFYDKQKWIKKGHIARREHVSKRRVRSVITQRVAYIRKTQREKKERK